MEFKNSRTFQQKSILNFNLNIIKYFGYWQPKNLSKFLQVLYGIYSIIIIVSAIFNVITESIDVIKLLIAGDIYTFANNAYLYFLNFSYAIRAMHFHAMKEKILSLVDAMDQQMFQPRTKDDMLLCTQHAKKWLVFCKAYIFCGIITVCFFVIFPFIDSEKLKLPFFGWYPVGDDWFVVLYLYQELQEFSLGMCNISFASITMCILSYLSMQMDLLRNRIKHLRERCEEQLSARSGESFHRAFDYQQELERLMNENLVDCICLHQTILRYNSDIGIYLPGVPS